MFKVNYYEVTGNVAVNVSHAMGFIQTEKQTVKVITIGLKTVLYKSKRNIYGKQQIN